MAGKSVTAQDWSSKISTWTDTSKRSYTQPSGLWLPSSHFVPPQFPFTPDQTATLIYPRPDGETPSWAFHRNHFYNGVLPFTQRIPIVFRGGSFPYNVQILDAPAAANATIGASQWAPNWKTADAVTNGYCDLVISPSAAYTNARFWIRGYDQTGAFQDAIFTASTVGGYYYNSVTPADSYGFVFLDPVNGVDAGAYPSSTGLIDTSASPIKTLNWAWGPTAGGKTYPNAHIVCRAGTTPVFAQDSTYGMNWAPAASPSGIVGFHGESVTLDFTGAGSRSAFSFAANANDVFLQGFTVSGGPSASNYFTHLLSTNLHDRLTVHDVSFPNVFTGTAPTQNNNCGPLCLEDPTTGLVTVRKYIALKGVSQTNSSYVSNPTYNFAIITAYKNQYLCVELCSAINCGSSGPVIKASNSDVTVRGCEVSMAATGDYTINFYDQWNTAPCNNRELCYNVFDVSANTAAGLSAFQINGSYSAGVPAGQQAYGITVSYRNTFVGEPLDVNAPSTPVSNGPFSSINDAVQYGTSATQAVTISRANGALPANVTVSGTEAQASSGIVVGSGADPYALASAYSAWTGLRGARIA